MKKSLRIIAILALGCRAAPAATPAPAPPPDPSFIATPADLKARIPGQLRITKPDFVVFVPEVTDQGVNDTGNEHFLVFDGPDGSLMAVWTQSSAESQPDQHQAFARSDDGGKTWSRPRIVAGPKRPGDGHMASWGYPLVSRRGRIYILYSQHTGQVDNFPHHNGWLHGICSDDRGATWSAPQNVPVRRSTRDNPDPAIPPSMLCWQKPLRLGKDGRYFAGFTRWTSFAVTKNPTKSWISADSRVEFMRFENVDDNPEPKDLKISWFMADDKALAVPFPGHPEVSACQEPTVVKLPDGRLFCVMRTSSGSPFWSVSGDGGETWLPPRRLLRRDGGEPLLHPLSPCPMYDVGGAAAGSGRYALFIHNHDGHYGKYGPTDTSYHRRPIHLVPGRFRAGAEQPVWFDEPKLFMDHDGVSLGKPGTKGRLDLALYASFTVRDGVPVLWYPDRKFFLLGRIIGGEWLAPEGDPMGRTGSAPAAGLNATGGAVRAALPSGTPSADGDRGWRDPGFESLAAGPLVSSDRDGGWEVQKTGREVLRARLRADILADPARAKAGDRCLSLSIPADTQGFEFVTVGRRVALRGDREYEASLWVRWPDGPGAAPADPAAAPGRRSAIVSFWARHGDGTGHFAGRDEWLFDNRWHRLSFRFRATDPDRRTLVYVSLLPNQAPADTTVLVDDFALAAFDGPAEAETRSGSLALDAEFAAQRGGGIGAPWQFAHRGGTNIAGRTATSAGATHVELVMDRNTSNFESAQVSQVVDLREGARYRGACRMRWDSYAPDAPAPIVNLGIFHEATRTWYGPVDQVLQRTTEWRTYEFAHLPPYAGPWRLYVQLNGWGNFGRGVAVSIGELSCTPCE